MSKIFQILLKFLAVGILLPILCYVFLIIVNFNDEAKSNKVIEFEKFLAQRAIIDDTNNGFVYAVGLSASPELDFYVAGVERIKHINRIDSLTTSISPDYLNNVAVRKHYDLILMGCGSPLQLNAACHEYLLSKTQEIDQMLADSTVLLQRYQVMMKQKSWYESIQYNVYNNASVHAPWSFAHRVLMLQIWREAAKGNINTVTQGLQQDSTFLRNSLLSTHSLVNFSISAALLKQNYQWGRFALRNFPEK